LGFGLRALPLLEFPSLRGLRGLARRFSSLLHLLHPRAFGPPCGWDLDDVGDELGASPAVISSTSRPDGTWGTIGFGVRPKISSRMVFGGGGSGGPARVAS
jgi:hypothetical protein